jgi:uncharacterized protein
MGSLTADEIITLLELQPHPEGGRYRETFRDTREVQGRAISTAIYFLLRKGEVSRWHRIDAAELWHWYAGAPLQLVVAADSQDAKHYALGANLVGGERPQAVVPANHWQQAFTTGEWTLAGCTVAPGFTFEAFELAPLGFEPHRTPVSRSRA